jgi:hypothetical protein
MQSLVYRLYQKGVRLPVPQQAVEGALRLSRSGGSGDQVNALKAELVLQGEATALPPLYFASVERITTNGIVIKGTEIIARRSTNKSSADHHRQTWWCLVTTYAIAAIDMDLDTLDAEQTALTARAQTAVRNAR